MKRSEFLKYLLARGVTVKDGSKHSKLYYNGRQSVLPRHPSIELKKGTIEGVKKQLGLK